MVDSPLLRNSSRDLLPQNTNDVVIQLALIPALKLIEIGNMFVATFDRHHNTVAAGYLDIQGTVENMST